MGTSGADVSAMIAAATQMAAGRELVPALGAGATSAPIMVELKPPLPDTSYAASATIIGGLTLLGALEVQGQPTVVDRNHVTVRVKNTGLVSLSGAYVAVTAVRA